MQVANMLLISDKISINKNKQIYFFIFFLFFSIDILHFPTAVGTEGLFIACESWVKSPLEKVNFTKMLHWLSISYKGKKWDLGLFQVDSVNNSCNKWFII